MVAPERTPNTTAMAASEYTQAANQRRKTDRHCERHPGGSENHNPTNKRDMADEQKHNPATNVRRQRIPTDERRSWA